MLPDNSDGFQNYENGAATGSFAFFTLAALYDLDRRAQADQILFTMLDEYGRCGFEGRDAKGRSNDWRRWDGTAMGYEGFLTDNYYALLAVPLRQSEISWSDGFRPASTDMMRKPASQVLMTTSTPAHDLPPHHLHRLHGFLSPPPLCSAQST